MNKELMFVKSRITGGHYALKTERGKKPFENPMDIYIKIKLNNQDIVADIGAYVGEYSLWAVNNGAYKVLSYEATPNTFNILKRNRKGNMEIFNKAVIGSDDDYAKLFISKGIGVTNSVAKSNNKSHSISVPAIKYEKALQNATVVKIDVEGAEYSYNIIQPQLRAIILEFHPIIKQPWKDWAEDIINKIENSGYKRIYKPNFKSGWSLTGCWQR